VTVEADRTAEAIAPHDLVPLLDRRQGLLLGTMPSALRAHHEKASGSAIWLVA
jgi:hypothetical protein